jgi:hypothetical protein
MVRLFKYIKGVFRETGALWLFELKRIFGDGGVMLLFFVGQLLFIHCYIVSVTILSCSVKQGLQ